MTITKENNFIVVRYQGLTDQERYDFFDDLERSWVWFDRSNVRASSCHYNLCRGSIDTAQYDVYRLCEKAQKYGFKIDESVLEIAKPYKEKETKRQAILSVQRASIKKTSGCAICEYLEYGSALSPFCTYANTWCETDENEKDRAREMLKLYDKCDRVTAYPCKGCKYSEEAQAIIAKILREDIKI